MDVDFRLSVIVMGVIFLGLVGWEVYRWGRRRREVGQLRRMWNARTG